MGNGSWSIDQQRHNFQFGGQLFYEIRNGKLGPMLRDVAYQGSTVEFWNSMDGIGDKSTYFLGGAPNCGKGQPEQTAPVSHGAVPARFPAGERAEHGTKGHRVTLCQDDAKAITNKVLALSKADSCIVSLDSTEERHVRFAQNMATTNGSPSSLDINIESHFGKRSGSASGTDLSDDALAALVAASEDIAKRAPENPEFMPPIGPQKYPDSTSFSTATQTTTSDMLAAAILPVLQRAQAQNLQASGFLNIGTAFSSYANSKGLFAYDQGTDVLHTVTARTPDGTGSGWAGTTHYDFSKMDIGGMGGVAIDKAIRSQKPVRLDPGEYTVILEPSAVSDLLGLLISDFDQRAADEGRSFATKKGGGSLLGEKVFGPNVTIYSDPNDPLVPGAICSDDGLPAQRMSWGRGRRAEEFAVLALLGGEVEAGARPLPDVADHGRWHHLDGGHDQADQARPTHHPLLVHSRGRSANGAADRPDARRGFPDRERRDHTALLQFPL